MRSSPGSTRRARLLPALLLAFVALPAAAAERIAVLELTGNVPPEIVRAMTERVRAAALGPAGKYGYSVMTRESTALVLQENGGQCAEGQCEIEVARSVGAALVITGEVRKVGTARLADVRLHDTAKGNLLAVESFRSEEDLALVDLAYGATEKMLAAGLERYFGAPVEPSRPGARRSGESLRRVYLEVRVGLTAGVSTPVNPPVGHPNPEKDVPGALVGVRLNRSWALELGAGIYHYMTDPVSASSPLNVDLWTNFYTAGAAWHPVADVPFSIAAALGVARLDAKLSSGGNLVKELTPIEPAATIEARLDLPLGPFALGLRGAGVFSAAPSKAMIPGVDTMWLRPNGLALWWIGAAVQYSPPF